MLAAVVAADAAAVVIIVVVAVHRLCRWKSADVRKLKFLIGPLEGSFRKRIISSDDGD